MRGILLKKIAVAFAALALLVAPALLTLPQTAYANVSASKDAACQGVGLTGAECGDTTANNKVNGLISDIVNILSLVVGVVAVIMIIYSGFKYITSAGDSGNVSTAKNTLIYAIVGLIIIALAQVIVRLVVTSV